MGKNITSIVTEPDGCQITTDLVLNVFKDKLLMLLEVDEMWAPVENIFSSERTGTLSFGMYIKTSFFVLFVHPFFQRLVSFPKPN